MIRTPMMRKIVRATAALTAVFQVLVGVLSVVSPETAAQAFKVSVSAPAMLALIRMFGGLFATTGVISGLIAENPDRDRSLVRAFAGCLLLNVGADIVVIAAAELRFDQLAVGMLLELLLAVLLLLYRPS
jgi:uncharacterized protein DUF4345